VLLWLVVKPDGGPHVLVCGKGLATYIVSTHQPSPNVCAVCCDAGETWDTATIAGKQHVGRHDMGCSAWQLELDASEQLLPL